MIGESQSPYKDGYLWYPERGYSSVATTRAAGHVDESGVGEEGRLGDEPMELLAPLVVQLKECDAVLRVVDVDEGQAGGRSASATHRRRGSSANAGVRRRARTIDSDDEPGMSYFSAAQSTNSTASHVLSAEISSSQIMGKRASSVWASSSRLLISASTTDVGVLVKVPRWLLVCDREEGREDEHRACGTTWKSF